MRAGVGAFMMRSAAYAAALLAVLAATYYCIDPLRTARSYPQYYTDGLNHNLAVVGINNFNSRPDRRSYDSFILGNSLSKAVRVEDWKRYLPAGARPYHLSSDCQHLPLNILMLRYAAANVDSVRHVLLITSVWSLQDSIDYRPAAVPHPLVFDGAWRWVARGIHFMQGISRPMIVMGVSLKMSGRLLYTPRVSVPMRPGARYAPEANEVLFVDEINLADTVSEGSDFFRLWESCNRIPSKVDSDHVTPRVERRLRQLKALVDRCGATIDVVMVPDEERTLLSAHDVAVMREIFGSRFHDLTPMRMIERDDIRNYYDSSHFDPDMAARLLDDALGGAQ